jgi:hypothetical protein
VKKCHLMYYFQKWIRSIGSGKRIWDADVLSHGPMYLFSPRAWIMVMTEESLHSSSMIYLLAACPTTELRRVLYIQCWRGTRTTCRHAPWHAPTCRWAERPRDKHACNQGAGMHPLCQVIRSEWEIDTVSQWSTMRVHAVLQPWADHIWFLQLYPRRDNMNHA